jgi:hypothetical protein
MTSGKQTTQELGGWQILTPGEPLASVKSPCNCHAFLIYIGGELEEELQESLTNTKMVQHLTIENSHPHCTKSINRSPMISSMGGS